MLSEEYEKMMLIYLSCLEDGPGFGSAEDLGRLSAKELLLLSAKVEDQALGLFVQLLKRSQRGENLFEKLMGDHEEENRPLVDAFFSRYLGTVVSNAGDAQGFNPLEAFLPARAFDDLAFVQSRQAFFLRQTAETLNEYLDAVFGGRHAFQPGEQLAAWTYFWKRVVEK